MKKIKDRLRIIGPKWEEGSVPSFTSPESVMKKYAKEADCRFCNLNEEPIIENPKGANDFRVLETRFPYYPEHVMILSKPHYRSLHEIGYNQYLELTTMTNRLFKRGRRLMLAANYGIVASQTIPHLHLHLMPEKIELKGNENLPLKLDYPKKEAFDPLSIPILTYMREKKLLPKNAKFPNRRGVPALIIKFENLKKFKSKGSYRIIKELFENSEKAFNELKENPEMLTAHGYPSNAVEKFRRLLRERTMHGFGANWAIKKVGKGFEFHFLPRATVINPAKMTDKIGLLEAFWNVELYRIWRKKLGRRIESKEGKKDSRVYYDPYVTEDDEGNKKWDKQQREWKKRETIFKKKIKKVLS